MKEAQGKWENIPLDTSISFTDTDLGKYWREAGEAVNALAEKLMNEPRGTAVTLASKDGAVEVWFLAKVKDVLQLQHAVAHDEVTEVSSRHDFDPMFVDIDQGMLEEYASRVRQATEEFSLITIGIDLTEIE